MKKTELLLPVGNNETFYAALEGGADAVYLGLKYFNARGRALNFSNRQIPVLIDLAHKKIYKVGILMYGKKISYKELWKWLKYK